MASTYTPIATQTLGSAASSVTFSSIAGTYTDLVLICSVAMASNDYIIFRVGSGSIDTGSNYSQTTVGGNGTSAISSRASNRTEFYFPEPFTTSTNTGILNFQNYSNSTTYKTMLMRGNGESVTGEVALWRFTSAIDTIRVLSYSGVNFTVGSTFTLYGIASAT